VWRRAGGFFRRCTSRHFLRDARREPAGRRAKGRKVGPWALKRLWLQPFKVGDVAHFLGAIFVVIHPVRSSSRNPFDCADNSHGSSSISFIYRISAPVAKIGAWRANEVRDKRNRIAEGSERARPAASLRLCKMELTQVMTGRIRRKISELARAARKQQGRGMAMNFSEPPRGYHRSIHSKIVPPGRPTLPKHGLRARDTQRRRDGRDRTSQPCGGILDLSLFLARRALTTIR